MKIPLFCQRMAKEWYFLLAKHCLEEFKLDCQLRRLTDRTIKGYYNNTLNFLIYAEKHHSITEVEKIYTFHIKHPRDVISRKMKHALFFTRRVSLLLQQSICSYTIRMVKASHASSHLVKFRPTRIQYSFYILFSSGIT